MRLVIYYLIIRISGDGMHACRERSSRRPNVMYLIKSKFVRLLCFAINNGQQPISVKIYFNLNWLSAIQNVISMLFLTRIVAILVVLLLKQMFVLI